MADEGCLAAASQVKTDAQARALYACKYFEAVSENARVNQVIAGLQQAAAFYFADKQHGVAKQAQNRLDAQWENQRDKGDKLFNHWFDGARPEELEQLKKASDREEAGYTVDYETAKNRVLADVRQEFGYARQKLERESNVHCVGATKVALRALQAAEARAAVAAINGAWRAEETRKDLKEAQNREELYKWLGLFKGVVGDSLNASKGAAATAAARSQVNPYSGWQEALGGLSRFGAAWNAGNTAGVMAQNSGLYASLFHDPWTPRSMGGSGSSYGEMHGGSYPTGNGVNGAVGVGGNQIMAGSFDPIG